MKKFKIGNCEYTYEDDVNLNGEEFVNFAKEAMNHHQKITESKFKTLENMYNKTMDTAKGIIEVVSSCYGESIEEQMTREAEEQEMKYMSQLDLTGNN